MSGSATYTHLRDGSWGVRIPGTAAPNQTVTVTKKDGETRQETVAKVLWTGRDSKSGQTISLCSIARQAMGAAGAGGGSQRGTCEHCGEPCNPRYRTCYECKNGGMSYYDSNGNFVLGSED